MSTTPSSPDQPWQPPESASPQACSLHNNLVNALGGLQRNLVRSIIYLRTIRDRQVYRLLGFTSMYDYAAQAAGLHPGQCKAFLRLGARLQDLPGMQQALMDGSITWRKADILVGEANRENEAALIEAAKKFSEAELKDLTQAAPRPVETPLAENGPAGAPHPKPPSPPNTGQTSPAPGHPRQEKPERGHPPQDAPPRKRPRQGPAPVRPRTDGQAAAPPSLRSAHEVQHVLFKLSPEQYGRWTALLNRLRISKEEGLIEGLEALLGSRKGHAGGGGGGGYLVVLHHCPDCGQAVLKNKRGSFEAPRALLEAAHCDGIREDPRTARRRRVVPPRLRRRVLERDGYQCAAEGCGHTENLEMHHRTPAAQGGRSVLDNLVTLCRRCHRRLHEEEEALRTANRGPGS